jgi:hypothetical protein
MGQKWTTPAGAPAQPTGARRAAVITRAHGELGRPRNSKDSRSAPGLPTQAGAAEKPITPELSADARELPIGDVAHGEAQRAQNW